MSHAQNREINVGMFGLGIVAGGVNNSFAERLLEHNIHLKTVVVRDLSKNRDGVQIGTFTRLSDDPYDILNDPQIDIVVELTGAELETSRSIIKTALQEGKHAVTAGKQVLAHYLPEFNDLARTGGLSLSYEAAVGGAIPVIRVLGEYLRVQKVNRVEGIINGTDNSILTRMGEGMTFDSALCEAIELGVAEPDPTDDIEGYDARAKLSVLATLASGYHVKQASISCHGISKITLEDIADARERGGVIKLLASARKEDGIWIAQVRPEFVPKDNPLSSVMGTFNSVTIDADLSGPIMLYGRGAGRYPTAGAVLADILHASEHVRYGTPDFLPKIKESSVLVQSGNG
ncbi:MAG: homoserine dehydrogenase [Candidatus Omnitrophota bacterium]|nr:homoserine dehydrogenase [Candidatus Omnitrophota bacterium]